MAREASEEDRHGGEQAHNPAYGKGLQAGHGGPDTAADGGEGAETPEEYEKRIAGYAEAVKYFLDHPEAPLNPVVRAFIESIRKDTQSKEPSVRQSTLN